LTPHSMPELHSRLYLLLSLGTPLIMKDKIKFIVKPIPIDAW